MLRVEALTLNQEGSKREFDYINILHAIKGSELRGNTENLQTNRGGTAGKYNNATLRFE